MLLKPLIILIAIIAATEVVLMVLLANIVDEALLPTWIPALFDATVVSLVAILAINRMLKYGVISLRGEGRSEFMQLKVGLIVFVFEAIIMLVLYVSPLQLDAWQEILFDVFALTLGSSLVIYGMVLKSASQEEKHRRGQNNGFDSTVSVNVLGYICMMTLLLMALIATYEQQLQARVAEVQQQESKELELTREAYLTQLHHAARDILIMARQKELERLVEGETRFQKGLEQDYQNIAMIKDYFAQIRFLDRHGMEVIRVQRGDGQVYITPPEQRQNKGDRYYFQEGLRLSPGEIYLSPLDLNVEHGEVEQPLNPMIRLTTPIMNRNGEKAGAIIINLSGKHLLKALEESSDAILGKLMMLNDEGYWLYGGTEASLWAFMFPDRATLTFPRWKPTVWAGIQQLERGTLVSGDETFIIETIAFSPDRISATYGDSIHHDEASKHWPVWKLVSYLPGDLIMGQMRGIRDLMLLLYVVILLLAALGTAVLTRAMLKRKQAEEEIRHLAFYDSLTGLANRRLFHEKVELEMAHAARQGSSLALLYLDLDHFKPINDDLGHKAGDAALREVAERLEACLRDCDTIARLGGDEFAVLLPRPGSQEEVATIAQRIVDRFSEPFHPLGHTCSMGVSIGIAMLAQADETPHCLTQRADHAMYDAKRAGRNGYRFA